MVWHDDWFWSSLMTKTLQMGHVTTFEIARILRLYADARRV